jgi:hypothetical protein
MFARVTKYKMKSGSRDEATKVLNSLQDKIMGMPGMIQFLNVANEDGSGYVVSVVESQATSDGNAATVAALWANFAPFLDTAPVAEGFDVMANWT